MKKNLSQIQEEKGFLEKEGIYDVKVTNVVDKLSKTDKEMTVIELITVSEDANKAGYKANLYLVWTPEQMGFIKHRLAKMGINVEDEFDTSELIGNSFTVEAKYQMQNKVDAFGDIIGQERSDMLNIKVV